MMQNSLPKKEKWNSAINRLYYAAYYAVTALLLDADLKPTTHNGAKSVFSEHFIKTGIIPKIWDVYIHRFLPGVKRVITMIFMILTAKK